MFKVRVTQDGQTLSIISARSQRDAERVRAAQNQAGRKAVVIPPSR